jgi:hypothetical protein
MNTVYRLDLKSAETQALSTWVPRAQNSGAFNTVSMRAEVRRFQHGFQVSKSGAYSTGFMVQHAPPLGLTSRDQYLPLFGAHTKSIFNNHLQLVKVIIASGGNPESRGVTFTMKRLEAQ